MGEKYGNSEEDQIQKKIGGMGGYKPGSRKLKQLKIDEWRNKHTCQLYLMS